MLILKGGSLIFRGEGGVIKKQYIGRIAWKGELRKSAAGLGKEEGGGYF